MIIDEIIKAINESSKIAITFHESPDGDSIGSSLALLNALRKIKKESYIICKEKVPDVFSFLSRSEEIDGNCPSLTEGTDCLIALDCGNTPRLNCNVDFENRNFKIINIDHHLSNDKYGDINFVDTTAASVGEIMYKLIKAMNIEIDVDIASCIYTSILTDTGSFRHSSTTYVTHDIVSNLIKTTKLDFSAIHRKIFDNKEFSKMKLLGLVIDDMYLACNGKLCVMKLTLDMMKKAGVEDCDSAEIIYAGLKIGTVEAAFLIKEKEDCIKASLRSKEYVDVRKIAENYGGGGHIRASGLSMNKSIDEAEKLLLKDFENELM